MVFPSTEQHCGGIFSPLLVMIWYFIHVEALGRYFFLQIISNLTQLQYDLIFWKGDISSFGSGISRQQSTICSSAVTVQYLQSLAFNLTQTLRWGGALSTCVCNTNTQHISRILQTSITNRTEQYSKVVFWPNWCAISRRDCSFYVWKYCPSEHLFWLTAGPLCKYL